MHTSLKKWMFSRCGCGPSLCQKYVGDACRSAATPHPGLYVLTVHDPSAEISRRFGGSRASVDEGEAALSGANAPLLEPDSDPLAEPDAADDEEELEMVMASVTAAGARVGGVVIVTRRAGVGWVCGRGLALALACEAVEGGCCCRRRGRGICDSDMRL